MSQDTRRRRRHGGDGKLTRAHSGTDMATALVGGRQDHELVMQFLSGRLWPDGARRVTAWVPVGFSMGGHLAWRLLRECAPVRAAVPICSTPSESLGSLLLRPDALHGPEPGPGPVQPPEVVHYFAHSHRTPGHWERYAGKRVLAVHGALDAVMPFRLGGASWARVAQHAAAAERFEEPGRGHVCSPAMVRRAAQFLWDHAVGPDAEAEAETEVEP